MDCTIHETKDGIMLSQYAHDIKLNELDKKNCMNITVLDTNGDLYLVQIPTEDFPEFVRTCQKALKTISP